MLSSISVPPLLSVLVVKAEVAPPEYTIEPPLRVIVPVALPVPVKLSAPVPTFVMLKLASVPRL